MIAERIEKRKREKEELQGQLAIEMGKQVSFTAPQVKAFLYSLKRGNINDENNRRGIINIFLRAIYLFDDRLTLILNGGDRQITIDNILIDEIEEHFADAVSYHARCSPLVAAAPPTGNLENTAFSGFSSFLGSLSNVGVRAQGEQNPRPEGTEVSEPEGDSFECLDCVVLYVYLFIGQAKIESVEYVGLPVDQRLAAGFEFGKFESVAGVEPEVETPQSGRAVGGIHEVVEGFLEGVGLQKPVREAEHDVHSGAILIGETLAMGEQQPPRSLEIPPLFLRKGRLEGAPGVLHGLRTASQRPSQTLCKPPMRCRIEASHRR